MFGPDSVLPDVGRALVPLPLCDGGGPVRPVVGLDVGEGRARHAHLQIQEHCPAQPEWREHVPGATEAGLYYGFGDSNIFTDQHTSINFNKRICLKAF